MIKLSEDDFYKLYNPQINHIVRNITDISIADEDICSFGGCLYETTSPEIDYVMEMSKENRVLTIIEGDSNDEEISPLFIITGVHYVNRIGFLVLDKPYKEEFEVELEY